MWQGRRSASEQVSTVAAICFVTTQFTVSLSVLYLLVRVSISHENQVINRFNENLSKSKVKT